MPTVEKLNIKEKLKEVFGYNQFRGDQELIIKNLLNGKDTFVIMPTGAGKSLCYQLPAISMDGTAIVISPLIALMKNQVDQLRAFGVNAQFLNSTLTKSEMNKVKKETLAGNVKLLYVAPESLTKEENVAFLLQANISFVAIDEAHCISEWGHDFRPEYRRIRTIIDELGNLPVIALTATATPKVQIDIIRNLRMEDAMLYKSSFNRKNLYYEVRPKTGIKKQLIKFIQKHKGKSGIIYCLSRKKVEEIASLLSVNDVKALPYHAGLEGQTRMRNQDAFLNEDADVIVATIAFGMGIDKPDVRYVIHYDVPKSLEGYYQETGRAGRDGLEGNCILFYSYDDILKLEKFSKDKPVTERDNSRHLLMEMASYAESAVCRRKQLLHYFGETLEENCGFCDNCLRPKEQFEAHKEIVLALRTLELTQERFGIDHMVDVLLGSDNQYVTSYNHNKLDVYKKGEGKSAEKWHSIFRQALIAGFMEKDIDNYGILTLSAKGKEFIKKPYDVMLSIDHDYSASTGDDSLEERGEAGADAKPYDPVLFDMLKALRKKLAKERDLPPYVIFQDPSLEEMATTFPQTQQELAQVNGVGMGKVNKFGKPFMEMIVKYVEDNDLDADAEVVVKSAINKSKIKIFIIQQVDRKIDLDEIAEAKGISMNDLIQEIEHICYSGTRLNLDYYIEDMMDVARQDEVYDYFMNAPTDSISDALAELGEDEYTEEDLRLMRVKFLSEVAN